MTFSEKLRQTMKEFGINQSQLVKLTGKSKAAISLYVNGKVMAPKEVQEEIALSLGLGKDYFQKDKPDFKLADEEIPTLKIPEVAKLMHKHVGAIALGLQQGVFPWGYAIQTGENRWTYFINARRFEEIEMVNLGLDRRKDERKEVVA